MAESNIVRELLVRVGLVADFSDFSKADKAIDRIKSSLQSAGDAAGRAKEQVVSLGTQFVAAGAAIAGAVGGLALLSDQTAQHAVAVTQQSAALGLSTDAYQELTGAMAGMDIEQDQVVKLMEAANDASISLASGNEETAKSFKALGISAKDIKGKSLDQVFATIAEGAKNTTDEAARLDAVTNIFGNRLGTRVLPFLLQGADGIASLRGEVRDLGGVMDAEAIAAANRYDDSVDRLTITVKGIGHEIGAAFLPALTAVTEGMEAWFMSNRKAITSGIQRWVGLLADGIRRLARFVGEATPHVDYLTRALVAAAAGASALFVAMAAFKAGSAAASGLEAIVSLTPGVRALGSAMVDLGKSRSFEQVGDAMIVTEKAGTGLLTVLGGSLTGLTGAGLVGVFAAIAISIIGLLIPIASLAAGFTTVYAIAEDLFLFLFSDADTLTGEFVAGLVSADSNLGSFARTLLRVRDLLRATLSIMGSLATMTEQTAAPVLRRLAPVFNAISSAIGDLLASFQLLVTNAVFAPFYLFEQLLNRILPLVNALAANLQTMAAGGGGLFGSAGLAEQGALVGQSALARQGFAPAPMAGGGRSFVDNSQTSFSVSGAQQPAAVAAAIGAKVDAVRGKQLRAARATLGGGEV